jgi:hypothetical protein
MLKCLVANPHVDVLLMQLILTLPLTSSPETVQSVSDLIILWCFILQLILFDDFLLKKLDLELQN